MYTSTYSSSPVRTFTSGIDSTNHQQQQSFDRQYTQPSTTNHFTMDEGNFSTRRMPNNYSNPTAASIPIRTGTSSRKYTSNMNNSSNDPISTRYTTNTSSSYRPYGENLAYRSNSSRYDGNQNNNERAQSYDDLLHEQHRSQSSIYNSNSRLGNPNQYSYGQPQQQQQPPPTPARREHQNDYDDDIVVKSTDLSATNEQEMLELVRSAFRKYDLANQRELAGFLKRSADKTFSSCWHCIVGRQFSSYVTHEMNGFIYLTKGPLSILLFKSGS